MRKLGILLLVVLCSFGSAAQTVKKVKYEELQKEFSAENKLTVVNFWATWCGPCIKELPYFNEASKREDLNVLLVSLDFPNQMEKVEKFVAKKNLTAKLYLLDETDYDDYMPKISENWSGAIPATLFVDKYGDRYFYEKAFSKEALNKAIDKHSN